VNAPRLRVGLLGLLGLVCFVGLTGCAGERVPDVTGAAIILEPGSTSATVEVGAGSTQAAGRRDVDRWADLDVEDQVGDGTRVRIEAVRTSLPRARLEILDAAGRVVGTDVVTPAVQVVTVELTDPIRASGQFVARLVVDDAADATARSIYDDEGEPVTEDFDYRLG